MSLRGLGTGTEGQIFYSFNNLRLAGNEPHIQHRQVQHIEDPAPVLGAPKKLTH
jgi:hypothetical protein